MSLYNMLFGKNPLSGILLSMLDLTEDETGRFKDCFIENDKIVVHTRNGGGNRECWEQNEEDCRCPGCIIEVHLPKHPNYLYDEDDDFDCTYANIYFSVPEEHQDNFKLIKEALAGTPPPKDKWKMLLNSLKQKMG